MNSKKKRAANEDDDGGDAIRAGPQRDYSEKFIQQQRQQALQRSVSRGNDDGGEDAVRAPNRKYSNRFLLEQQQQLERSTTATADDQVKLQEKIASNFTIDEEPNVGRTTTRSQAQQQQQQQLQQLSPGPPAPQKRLSLIDDEDDDDGDPNRASLIEQHMKQQELHFRNLIVVESQPPPTTQTQGDNDRTFQWQQQQENQKSNAIHPKAQTPPRRRPTNNDCNDDEDDRVHVPTRKYSKNFIQQQQRQLENSTQETLDKNRERQAKMMTIVDQDDYDGLDRVSNNEREMRKSNSPNMKTVHMPSALEPEISKPISSSTLSARQSRELAKSSMTTTSRRGRASRTRSPDHDHALTDSQIKQRGSLLSSNNSTGARSTDSSLGGGGLQLADVQQPSYTDRENDNGKQFAAVDDDGHAPSASHDAVPSPPPLTASVSRPGAITIEMGQQPRASALIKGSLTIHPTYGRGTLSQEVTTNNNPSFQQPQQQAPQDPAPVPAPVALSSTSQEQISTGDDEKSGPAIKPWVYLSCIGLLVIVVVVVVVVLLVVSGGGDDGNNDNNTSFSGDFEQREDLIRSLILDNSITKEPFLFQNKDSPQNRALEWVVRSDSLTLNQPNTKQIINRYILVVMYYKTKGQFWFSDTNWLDGTVHECEWQFVSCDGQQREIISLNTTSQTGFGGNRINGPLPDELSGLKQLTVLELKNNRITSFGALPSSLVHLILPENDIQVIPDVFGNLSYLQVLNLELNVLEGNLPPSILSIANLVSLDVSDNKLIGNVPGSFVPSSSLEYVDFDNNDLSGNLDVLVANLSNLQTLSLMGNHFTGTIPFKLFQQPLTFLDLRGNDLEGAIETSIGLLNKLQVLLLGNSQLLGSTIPTEIGNLSSLRKFELTNSGMTGVIPSEIGKMTSIEMLRILNTPLEGTLPSEIGHLKSITQILRISNTGISGPIPSEIGFLSGLQTLNFQNNNLGGSIPKELGQLEVATEIDLSGNQNLSGVVPNDICNLPSVNRVLLSCDDDLECAIDCPACICVG